VSIRLDGGMALLLGGFALAGVSGVRLRARRLERERQRSRRWVRDHLSARAAADPGLDADLGASSDRGSLSAPRLSLRGIPDPTHDSDEVKAGQS
jgi:hypothetical protein